MPPFFSPTPIEHPRIPIHVAGVQPVMCRLAGEVADGLHLHPFHSVRYVREVVVPAVQQGLAAGGRRRADCSLVCSVIVATGESAAAVSAARLDAKRQIAFYASTPNYRPVLECHGWSAIGPELTRKSVRGDWEGMASAITDEMLDIVAVAGPPDEISEKLRARYEGLVDRLSVYAPFERDCDLTPYRSLLAAFGRTPA
jgi:probable F420-dependent oxidoreductase